MGIPGLAEIERLITEHGSAVILKERLALASDQYSALEKKLSEANVRNEQLQSENARLHLDLEKAQEKIRNLEEVLINKSAQDSLPKEQQEILLLLMKAAANEDEVASALGCSKEAVRFDLVELEESGLIERMSLFGAGTHCSLTQDGRRYLKTNGMLA